MKRKIVAISVLMLLFCSIVAFAQNSEADRLYRDARSALSEAGRVRSQALSSRDATFVLQSLNRLEGAYSQLSRQLNNLTNRGVVISESNLREIARCSDLIESYFYEVRNHHQRLLM